MLIEERVVSDGDLAALLDAAFRELVRRYGAEGRSAVHEGARFLVGRVEGRAVGCGALQPSAEPCTGELKRMYVAPEFRGRGIASAVLAGLEELGAEVGYCKIRLATGARQPEAMALYERRGYRLIEPYGKYTGDALVRCYQKTLAV
jgi:GNAT superfamily N-acetyltransferase